VKRTFLVSTWMGILTLATIACSLGSIEVEESASTTPTPMNKQMVSDVSLTETIATGGFVTGTPLDPATLPTLTASPAGGEPTPCFVNNTQPMLGLMSDIFPDRLLCLYNFPTAADSPNIIVTLTDPTGRTFSDTLTYSQDGIVNSEGQNIGYVDHGGGLDGQPSTPGVSIELYMPASLPGGQWSITAKTQDGSISAGPTFFDMGPGYPRNSVLSGLDTNPFVHPEYGWKGPVFTNGQTIYFVGTAYSPNTTITIAFYLSDPSAGESESFPHLTARYAASITTDGSGAFTAQFVVDSVMPGGAYYAVAVPTITADIKPNYFDARFAIQ
jgi:hypothetical protein